MSANNAINCGKAEAIGFQIQNKLDKVLVSEAKIKKGDKIITLDSLYREVKLLENKTIVITPNALFNCLVALAQRSINDDKCFEHQFATTKDHEHRRRAAGKKKRLQKYLSKKTIT